ncbi:hypothetical protein [Rubinisphaera sp.]|uniref:hypothetical protein n=1 Tax=Rubinisphaera sp. TaxID=2024857 RepID=UPI000C0F3D0C|nr:hypothetical protein [Rubinisphaera sp.]MBV07977.1 hypothetical protein [Rubinisphaera sp.]HCS50251.1 hypothetical protein [Planctomycetaceae bacterium]|tara:strand:+ start:332 stop:529 length:198 start_codon:yes stop_codon:yes gene_type:complete
MKRISSLLLGSVTMLYLGLWVYQLGFEDGRSDAVEIFEDVNQQLHLKVIQYEMQSRQDDIALTGP